MHSIPSTERKIPYKELAHAFVSVSFTEFV